MKPTTRRCWIVLAAVLACTAWSAGEAAEERAAIPAGIKAGMTCSGVFAAGRELPDVLREELTGINPMVDRASDPALDRENRAVLVSYEGGDVPRLALFREGLGTILLPPGATIENPGKLPEAAMPMPPGDPAEIPWPDGDRTDGQKPPEVDQEALHRAMEAAFTDPKYEPSKTIGVVVVYKDAIIAERYAPGWGMHTQYRTWSSAKSLTNALVGILVGQGKLTVKQPAPIPEWQSPDDPRRPITIENLLHMSSGLESDGAYTTEAYWGGIDTAADAARSRLEAEPGTRWKYANYDTLLLVRSVKEVIGDPAAYITFPRRALFNKIGMRDTVAEVDPYGNFILSSQVYTTPRDLARFGLLFLHDGVWNGERILPEGWVEFTVAPAPARRDDRAAGRTGYGAQFWLYGFDPRLPDDAYSAAGARGQFCTIVPSRDLVVARMGLDPLVGDKWDHIDFVAQILDALPPDGA